MELLSRPKGNNFISQILCGSWLQHLAPSAEVVALRGKMQDSKRKRKASEAANSEPYEVEYFARRHNISREQARELIR